MEANPSGKREEEEEERGEGAAAAYAARDAHLHFKSRALARDFRALLRGRPCTASPSVHPNARTK